MSLTKALFLSLYLGFIAAKRELAKSLLRTKLCETGIRGGN